MVSFSVTPGSRKKSKQKVKAVLGQPIYWRFLRGETAARGFKALESVVKGRKNALEPI
jgi:hypothetical protein